MPIQTQDLLLQLNPSQSGGASELTAILQRMQQMKLQRDQLAEQKRQHEEEMQIRRMEEEGQRARAAMLEERAAAAAAAKVEAAARKAEEERAKTLLAQRQAGGLKLAELTGAGQTQQALSMTPYLESLGSGVEELGSVNGLPTLRYIQDREADRRQQAQQQALTAPRGPDETAEQSLARLNNMGYPTNERGTLADPGGADRGPASISEPIGTGAPELGELDAETQEALAPGEADTATATEFGGEGDAEVTVSSRGMQDASLSMGDAYAQALRASEYARTHGGTPLRAPDEEDFTGAVPRDVIDMGANEARTLAQLRPALAAGTLAYPGDIEDPSTHRGSANITRRGVEGMAGLPPEKRLELFDKMRSGPDSAINSLLGIEAAKERQKTSQEKPITRMEESRLRETGRKAGKTSWDEAKVGEKIGSMQAADEVITLLSNDDTLDDAKAVNYLMEMTKNKGHQTEADAARAVGMAEGSTVDQIKAYIHRAIEGGYFDDLRESVIGFATRLRKRDQSDTFSWLDSVEKKARGHADPLVGEGYKEWVDTTVPAWVMDEYNEYIVDHEGGIPVEEGSGESGRTSQAPVGDDDFQTELIAQAMESDLDPEKMGIVIGPESGGNPAATSSTGHTGIIQLSEENAKALGTSTAELRKMTAAEQLPYAIRYLQMHGITSESPPEAYAMAVAAPKFIGTPDSTVVYKKGSKEWKANKPWRPDDGGDITTASILRFYGLRDDAAANARGGDGLPTPQTNEEQELLDALGE